MIRELAIHAYLLFFKIIFCIAAIFPVRTKAVFVTSFGDNTEYVASRMQQLTNIQPVFLKTPACRRDFSHFKKAKIIPFTPRRIRSFLRSIYHLATSKFVFVDNYYGFLSEIKFKKGVTCVQLWHAAGAIKKFGLQDPSIEKRSKAAKNRFQKVYNTFDYVVTGSDTMGDIYQQSFGIPKDRILPTGIPRTDFFFHTEQYLTAKSKIESSFPEVKEKKVILYAPTFREGQLNSSDIALDIELLHKSFKEEYLVFLRLHPAVKADFPQKYQEFLYDVTKYNDVNHLLAVTDILITDYSSIPFEYALLQKPMIFYAYDLESYKKERGFWEDYNTEMPGPVVHSTEAIVEEIKRGLSYEKEVEEFAKKWNKYSDGDSSGKLVKFLQNLK